MRHSSTFIGVLKSACLCLSTASFLTKQLSCSQLNCLPSSVCLRKKSLWADCWPDDFTGPCLDYLH